MHDEARYELRHGWTRQNKIMVVICLVFVALAAIPWGAGRWEVDGILTPVWFPTFIRVVDALFFGGGAVYIGVRAIMKPLVLRVDRAGIAFRDATTPDALIPWSDIHAVELFVREVDSGSRTSTSPYLGVYRPPNAPAIKGAARQAGRRTLPTQYGPVHSTSRGLINTAFDRDSFGAVVARHAPYLPFTIAPDFRMPS